MWTATYHNSNGQVAACAFFQSPDMNVEVYERQGLARRGRVSQVEGGIVHYMGCRVCHRVL